ncbi:MAG TPA: hypothetical protein VHH88_14250 [Verrucomicrobiae bacterium]|nr:hypothetical protein [Verrucomicrobiae bacterium]
MAGSLTLGIVSDIHYACAAEQARGSDYESRDLSLPLRTLLRAYRHFVWLREPLHQNHLLDRFIAGARPYDYVVANGDFSCDTGFCGLSDEASFQSARECLAKLEKNFGGKLLATLGDHELGKVSFFGGRGGMRLASWERATSEAGLKPFWKIQAGRYVLMGIVSSLVALPVFEPELSPEERDRWHELREEQMAGIREGFRSLQSGQRVLVFCHDPTALPFLWKESEVQARASSIEATVIGHLHSKLILWNSKILAGIPRIPFLGNSVRRMTEALRDARYWRPFKVRLCPSLAGIELLKDGGFLTATLDLAGEEPARFQFHPIHR